MSNRFIALREKQHVDTAHDLEGLRICAYPETFKAWYIPDTLRFTPVHGLDNIRVRGQAEAGSGEFACHATGIL